MYVRGCVDIFPVYQYFHKIVQFVFFVYLFIYYNLMAQFKKKKKEY